MNEIKKRKAEYIGKLKLGNEEISCAVLEDGTRVLVERSMANALGRKGSGAYWKKKKEGDTKEILPEYVEAKYLEKYISEELRQKLLSPITYINRNGKESTGIDATVLPDICDLWIKAKNNNALTTEKQINTAKKAYILMRAFAVVGITALIDEATGYQEIRDRVALQKILEKYISTELLAWTKKFPDEFYMELFRLKNWQWRGMSVNRPSYVGKLTNDIIYERIAPGILAELKKITPRDEKGRTKHRFHQRLTEEIGHPALSQHLHAVIALMRAASNWGNFSRALSRAFPKLNETPELPFEDLD